MYLDNPTGVLISGVNKIKTGELIKFPCTNWTLAKMEKTENQSLEFVNDEDDAFKTTINFSCYY